MVKGIDKFRTHFRDYEQQFVLIGGAACDEWFTARNLTFRATKDLDIALVIQAFPADSPDWPKILAALRNTISRPPNPENLRKVISNYFLLKVARG